MSARLQKLAPILPARDIAAAEAFWKRLGFTTVYRDSDYLLMTREGAEVHFFRHPGLDPATNDHGAYLRPSDIDALDAEWARLGLPTAGIPRLVRAEDKPWGMRELALVDPDGNLVRAGQELPHADGGGGADPLPGFDAAGEGSDGGGGDGGD